MRHNLLTSATPGDAALIVASLADPTLFSTVFDRHFAAIYAYLARRAGREQAEDLASQTFCVAFERRASFQAGADSARPWLYGIAINLLRNEQRERRRSELLVRRAASSHDDSQETADFAVPLSVDRIGSALAQLDEDQRDALLLLAWGELSYPEIAAALAVPVGTVRSRIARQGAHARTSGPERDDRHKRGCEMSDELTELRVYRDELAVPSAAAWAQAREALGDLIAIEQTAPAADAHRRTRVWRLRTAIAAAAVLVVAAVATTTLHSSAPLGSTPGSLSAGGPPPTAHIVLERLARVAADQPPAPAPKGAQYRLTSVDSEYTSNYGKCTLLLPKYRQTWVDAQGAGAIFEREGRPKYLAPSEAGRCSSVLANVLAEQGNGVVEGRFTPHCLTTSPVSLRGLPTDPARLREGLENGSIEEGPHTAAGTFSRVGDLLRNTHASSRLRAALYKVAASLPGVRSLGEVKDHAGRSGVGLAVVDGPAWQELIFDPKTSALIGERLKTVHTRGGVPAGMVTGWAVYYPSHLVNSLPPARPNAEVINCHQPRRRSGKPGAAFHGV